MRIAIQGVKGAFHQIAAEEQYGKGINVLECPTFESVCKAVSQKIADAGMLAIENTTIGSFLMNYKFIREYELFIIGEICLQIHHNLLALPNQKIEDLRIVRSQDYAIAQCSKFLKKNTHLKTEAVADTALAAKSVADKKEMGVAAIASVLAAEIYGLQILAEKIETFSRNFTRFLVLSKSPNPVQKSFNKATLSFDVEHKPGALVTALNVLKDFNVNMSKIQSVPHPELAFQYMMFLDVTWDDYENFEKAIKELKRCTFNLTIYGLYLEAKI